MNEAGWCYLEGYGCKKDKVRLLVFLGCHQQSSKPLSTQTKHQHQASSSTIKRRKSKVWLGRRLDPLLPNDLGSWARMRHAAAPRKSEARIPSSPRIEICHMRLIPGPRWYSLRQPDTIDWLRSPATRR